MDDKGILELAKSINITVDYEEFCIAMNYQEILAFARAIERAAREDERGQCAVVCEEDAKSNALAPLEQYRALFLADAIRARKGGE